MKRAITYISALAVILLLGQCSKSEPQNMAYDGGEKISITFSNIQTKSQIQDAIGTLKYKWELGDLVHAYDGAQHLGYLTLRAEDAGNELGTFEGEIDPPAGDEITFFYFGSEVTPPTSGTTTVDYYSQDGSFDWIEKHLIASCTVDYAPGQTLFSGKFSLPFAIGKFRFLNYVFDEGENIHVMGMMQKITVSAGGSIDYVAAEKFNCSVIPFNPSSSHYIVMPSASGNDHVTFDTYTKRKTFSDAIVNNIFYRSNDGTDVLVLLEDNPHYVENSTDFGPGLRIGDIIYAPVNLGYDETSFKYGKMVQWGRFYMCGYDQPWTDIFGNHPAEAAIQSNTLGPVSATNEKADEFYLCDEAPHNWLSTANTKRWNSADAPDDASQTGKINPQKTCFDPCPPSWRTPTYYELEYLVGGKTAMGLVAGSGKHEGVLGQYFNGTDTATDGVFLPAAGVRSYHSQAGSVNRSAEGAYWTSCSSGDTGAHLWFSGSDYLMRFYEGCGDAYSVRCVYDPSAIPSGSIGQMNNENTTW